MSAPLDEHALDDLDPEAKRLVKEMLKTVVEHPDIHRNRIDFQRAKQGRGYEYYLVPHDPNGPTPFAQLQRLDTHMIPQLEYMGFVVLNRDEGGYKFTDAAFEWHQRYGGPGPDEVRRKIGRHLRQQTKPGGYIPDVKAEAVAAAVGIPVAQADEQIRLLLGKKLLSAEHRVGGRGFGILSFTPEGVLLWAEAGFPPIASLGSQPIHINLSIEVSNIIEQARETGLPKDQVIQFEGLMRRAQEELEKPKGKGRFEQIQDLVSFAANFKELVPAVGKFVSDNQDKIQALADMAEKLTP